MTLKSHLICRFTPLLHFFHAIYWKNWVICPRKVSHTLDYGDCIPLVSFNMFLCPLYSLQILVCRLRFRVFLWRRQALPWVPLGDRQWPFSSFCDINSLDHLRSINSLEFAKGSYYDFVLHLSGSRETHSPSATIWFPKVKFI